MSQSVNGSLTSMPKGFALNAKGEYQYDPVSEGPYTPPDGATKNAEGYWELPNGNLAPGQMTPGRAANPAHELFWDPVKQLVYTKDKSGSKSYQSPAAWGGTVPAATKGMLGNDPNWNPKTGQFDYPTNYSNILSAAVAGGIGAGALSAAGALGGAAGGAAPTAASSAPEIGLTSSELAAGTVPTLGAATAGGVAPALAGTAAAAAPAVASAAAPAAAAAPASISATTAPGLFAGQLASDVVPAATGGLGATATSLLQKYGPSTAKALASAGATAAQNRGTDTHAGQNQDRNASLIATANNNNADDRLKATQDEQNASYHDALRAALAKNVKDINLTRPDGVPSAHISGGLRPSALGQQGLDAADLMYGSSMKQLKDPTLNPTSLPPVQYTKPTPLPTPGLTEKIAGPLGLLTGVLSANQKPLNPAIAPAVTPTTPGPNPTIWDPTQAIYPPNPNLWVNGMDPANAPTD